ncbi:RNA polymerase II mediator complex subunit [Microsporum audouinii]
MSSSYSQPLAGFSGLPVARTAYRQARKVPGSDLERGIGPGAKVSPVIDLTGSNDEDEDQESSRPVKRLRIDTHAHDELARHMNISSRPGLGLLGGEKDGEGEDDDDQVMADEVPATPFVIESTKPPATFQDRLAYMSIDGGGQQPQSSSSLPLPLPPRPPRTMFVRDGQPGVEDDEQEDMVVQTTPYTMEEPAAAARLADNTILDFHPWTGNHPEDALNEQTAKQGFYDRVQLSQNESNTARPSLYSHFKNPNGLKALSHIFTAALKRREAITKITPASTFKPPPRVTLTDNKREAWLRDLANPTVPLRRLSRTIPHGIRGKILLDQCLAKNVPIGRAIWLAKCVGANEIRAFKRKGTAAAIASGLETKWVRDWTGSVQQFMEGVVQSREETGWIENQAYAMRLTGRLFMDQLLDQDTFLEWLLSSLQAASLDLLPVWLSTLGIYWKNLTNYRKRGRRLAQILLDKLAFTLNNNQSAVLNPLIFRLQSLIRSFITCHPSSFILPLTWSHYHKPLTACFNTSNSFEVNFLTHLTERNNRLSKTNPQSNTSSPQSTSRPAPQQLISYLDLAYTHNVFPVLASKCLSLPLDHRTMVYTLLEWSSTPFRYGSTRIYVSARLLRRWRKLSIDTDAYILSFLAEYNQHTTRQFENIYHVISELVRSQSFSVGKYLEWLMARGAVRSPDAFDQCLSADVELLRHIPSSRLPEHIWNLRNTLLSRAGVSVDAETWQIRQIKAGLQQMYPDIFTEHVDTPYAEMIGADFDWASLTWTVRSDVSHWIREQIASKLQAQAQVQPSSGAITQRASTILRPDQFYSLRSILERMNDLPILADILKLLSQSTNPTVLASITDTLNYHFPSFTAIGATMDLFQSFALSYSRISKVETHLQDFIVALLDVALVLPSEASTVAVLRRDLARCEKKSAMAASSPVSEHMADTLNPVNPTFSGMLDQLLASGNCMDDATLMRIFDLLIQKLETGKADISLSFSEAARYLAQLRLFNPKTFDGLMMKRVLGIIRTSPRPKLSEFLPPLIGVGCITFPAILGLVKKLVDTDRVGARNIPDVMQLRLDMLSVLGLENANRMTVPDLVFYRFKISRQEFIIKHFCGIVGTIRDVLIDASASNSSIDGTLQEQWNKSIFPLLCELIVRHSKVAKDECVKWVTEKFPTGLRLLAQTLDSLLNVESSNGNFDVLQSFNGYIATDTNLHADFDRALPDSQSVQQQALGIIQRIDDFSLPFCLVKLQLLLAGADATGRENVLDPIFSAAEMDVKKGLSRWLEVITVLDDEGRRQIQQKAESKLLLLFITSATSALAGPSDDTDEALTPYELGLVYLRIIEELVYKAPRNSISSPIGNALLERMNLLLQRTSFLTKIKTAEMNPANTTQRHEGGILGIWVYILLRLVSLYRSVFVLERASKADLTDQTRLLLSICYLAFTPGLGQVFSRIGDPSTVPIGKYAHLYQSIPASWHGLRTYAVDVATILVDTLPDDARLQCARFLRDRSPLFAQQQDNRLLYLFGPMPDPQASSSNSSNGTTTSAPPIPGSSPLNVQNHAAQGGQAQVPHQTSSSIPTVEETNSPIQNFRFQQGNRVIGPCPPRTWEMLEESAPVAGVNDTALNLSYFGARMVRPGLE